MVDQALTALGNARVRFLDALPGRAQELSDLVARWRFDGGDPDVRMLVRRRLQTLAASARLFEEMGLLQRVEHALQVLGDGDSADVAPPDLEGLAAAVAQVLQLSQLDRDGRSDRAPGVSTAPTTFAAPPGPARASGPGASAPAAPIEVTQSVSGLLPSPSATAVLVIDSEAVIEQVRAGLPDARFDVNGSSSPEQGLRLMHVARPEVVLVGLELAQDPGLDLVRRIRRDPVTDVRHVFLLADRIDAETVARLGCDGSVRRPIDGEGLFSLLGGLLAGDDATGGLRFLTEGTVDDIADRVASEIKRGLVESLQAGRDERIALEDTQELMAAAWSAIGRIRTHLTQRADGRLRFANPAEPAASGQRVSPLAGGLGEPASGGPGLDPAAAGHAHVVAGRRILVADDDPAVVWFFSGLLREAGATPLEAKNGQEALELSRAKRPHAVISDILMPKLDGFALCHALKQDVILMDVPIILLSWKEDFLHRMRELNAGASAYLRKEATSREILATLADVLRPRARIEGQLEAGRDVHGRVERVGIVPLLEAVIVRRPSARITVADAWNLFEVTLSDGQGIGVTRTASDGSFARGPRALEQLLGVRSGRFTVGDGRAEPRGGLVGPVDRVLQDAARQLSARLEAVSGRRLLRIGRVELDQGALPALLSATPAPLADVVERLQRSDGDIRSWLLSGEIAPQVLQDQLYELARRGVLTGVWDEQGQDLVEEALQERAGTPATMVHLSLAPPAAPKAGARPASSADLGSELAGAPSTAPPTRTEAPSRDAARVRDDSPEDATSRDARTSGEAPAHVSAAEHGGGAPSGGDVAEGPSPPGTPMSDSPAAWTSEWQAEGSGSRAIVLLTVVVLGFVGYFGFRAIGPELSRAAGPKASEGASAQVQSASRPPRGGPEPSGEPMGDLDREPSEAAGFGRLLPFIDRSRNVEVAPDEGLLVVEGGSQDPPAEVRVGGRSLGPAPVAVALPPGRHEVVFKRAEQRRFRYLVIRSGETRIVDVP